MIRALAIAVVAALCAAVFGVDRSLMAAQNAPSHQQVIAARIAKWKVGDRVKGQRADGSRFEGVLIDKTPSAITLDLYVRRSFRRDRHLGSEVIPLAIIRDIDKPLTGAEKALIAGAVVAGTCAAISVSLDSEAGERPETSGANQPISPPSH